MSDIIVRVRALEDKLDGEVEKMPMATIEEDEVLRPDTV